MVIKIPIPQGLHTMNTKTCLITGATSGFGEAIAKRFLDSGAKVIVTGRRKERLDVLKAQYGDQVWVICGDVCDQIETKKALEALPGEFSEIDVLVNNAGLALGTEPAFEADLNDWNTMIDTNIKGLVGVTHAVLPGMVERNRGYVINIGSIAGTYPYKGGNVYGGTKAFVHQFSLNLKADLVGKNIRVTCIEPGLAETEFSIVRYKQDIQKAGALYQGVQPLTAEDIADTVMYLTSLPEHVNINYLEIMPTAQAPAGLTVVRAV